MLRGGGAGYWTRASLVACYVLLVLIAAMWLCFHKALTALTAQGGCVLDKLNTSGGSWQARLQRAREDELEAFDLSSCGMDDADARTVATELPNL